MYTSQCQYRIKRYLACRKADKIQCIVKRKLVNKNRPKHIPNVEIKRQGLYNNCVTYVKVFARKDGQEFSGKDGRIQSGVDMLNNNQLKLVELKRAVTKIKKRMASTKLDSV